MKIEMAMEKGKEMIRARKEVSSVPARNGSAPNLLDTGSHVLLRRKAGPKAFSEGSDETSRLMKIAVSKTTRTRAEISRVFWKANSAQRP
jgi:hypothetical protein